MPYPVIPDIPQGNTALSDPTTTTQKESVKASNTATTLADTPAVVALAPANTGLPVNVPVILQKASATSTGSVASLAKAFTNANVAGNTIIVVAGCGNGTAMTVADSAGNTYTSAINAPNSTTFEAAIFYASGILAGANTVTVTNAGSTASMALEIYEVSGLLTQVTAQPDQSSSGTGTGTTATTSTLAASSPNSLVFMGVGVGTGVVTAVTAGTGFTNDGGVLQPATAAGLFQFIVQSGYLGSTTPIAPSVSWTTSRAWAAASAIFKPVVVGFSGTVTVGGYNYTNITTQTTTLVKTGAGVLHAVIINKPLASGVVEIDDALTHTSPVVGTITLPATLLQDGPKVATYDIAFSTGLSITTSGSTQDVTIVWK